MTAVDPDVTLCLGPTITATPHLAHPYRAAVVAEHIGRLNEAIGWYVHGDDRAAMHALNLMSDEELALAAVVCEWVGSTAAEIVGARRELGDEVGGFPVGAGRRRAI